MKTAIGFGMTGNEDWDELSTYAVEAERWASTTPGRPSRGGTTPSTPLAYLAAKTLRMKLGAGIMQAVARTPANLAMTAMTLASMSDGRFILGLGASGPQVVEGWHGVPFRKPIQRIRELIEIVRIVSRGERLIYDGQIYHLPLPGGEGKALKSGAQPQPNIPIYLATLSPKSLELTGELADGWIGTSFIPEQAEEVFFKHIRAGAAKAGRALADDRPAGGRRRRVLGRRRQARRAQPAGHRLHAGRDGIEGAQLLQRRVPARRATRRRASPCSASGSKASARKPPTWCPTRWCSP